MGGNIVEGTYHLSTSLYRRVHAHQEPSFHTPIFGTEDLILLPPSPSRTRNIPIQWSLQGLGPPSCKDTQDTRHPYKIQDT